MDKRSRLFRLRGSAKAENLPASSPFSMALHDAIHGAASRPAAYVVAAADGKYHYKGSTRDLQARLEDHLAGRVSRTKNRRPLSLVHCEYFDKFTEARKRELFLKSGRGRDWLKEQYLPMSSLEKGADLQ